MFIFFTEILKKDVVDRRGRYVGHPYDFIANLEESYPRVLSMVISRGRFRKKYYVIPWKDVHQVGENFQLKTASDTLVAVGDYASGEAMSFRNSVLDQQIVDTYNRKVVRVNDLHFLRVDDDLRLAHVDIGIRGLVRRLGWEGLVDSVVRFFNKHADYLSDERLISWKYAQPVTVQRATGKIQLSVDIEQLKKIPPSDISSMMMDLDPYQRAALLKSMDVQSQVDIITELELKWQKDLVEELDGPTLLKLFEKMPADEATDLLAELSQKDSDRILGMLSAKKARELVGLMEHESDSAGGVMTTEYIALREGMTVGEAIDHIRTIEIQKAETIYTAYVVDDDRKLIGSVSFKTLLLQPMEARIGDVMLTNPPAINVEESVEDVAREMDKYNLLALPTVDDNGLLEGIITIDDVLHVAVDKAWGRRG
ncbi:MAG TPA: CBS domain-containing protein [bacterium]|jgi:CBS domain-containing protein/sporulation protein YlmC with PRC-barrel domain|nr:CBS domain-containing protein [Myxococcales bacterium]HPW44800.1 CBS domain-containing protein [bacterium]HQC51038.1 CBS domain-containing protein [bacterium]